MHAGVVARNIQRDRAFSLNKQVPPAQPALAPPPSSAPVSRSASGHPCNGVKGSSASRGCVKRIRCKDKKGKKGTFDSYDYVVNIKLEEWQLTEEQVIEFKEVFMLFDKDEDGIVSFPELIFVMRSLGHRTSEEELLGLVREVSEDQVYDTIEFNEFLKMMSKQQRVAITEHEHLIEAFRIFDKDNDGFLSVDELCHIMQSLGDKMTDKDIAEMIDEADSDKNGLINYKEFITVLCNKSKGNKKLSRRRHKSKKKCDKDRRKDDKNDVNGVSAEHKGNLLKNPD